LLRSSCATGTLIGLDALFTANRTNAAAVGPSDQIKVTKVETFVLRNSWVFVKVSTDAGIVGWGEMLKDDAKACAAGKLEVGRYLVGQDPNRVVFTGRRFTARRFIAGGRSKRQS
jgi:L-alanine-DL-glutamate epimerase-like enolase superfamily enzyme